MRDRNFLLIKFLFFVFTLIFFFSNPIHSLMIKMSIEKLSLESDVIVVGEVKEIQCQWSMDKSTIMTIVTLQIQDVIKGGVDRNQILFQFPGGKIGDIGLKVSDMPTFYLHERILIFLKSIIDTQSEKNSPYVAMNFWPAYSINGAAQGKYSIDNKQIARKEGYNLISNEPDSDKTLSLFDLLTRIRKNLRQNSVKKKKIHEKRKY